MCLATSLNKHINENCSVFLVFSLNVFLGFGGFFPTSRGFVLVSYKEIRKFCSVVSFVYEIKKDNLCLSMAV